MTTQAPEPAAPGSKDSRALIISAIIAAVASIVVALITTLATLLSQSSTIGSIRQQIAQAHLQASELSVPAGTVLPYGGIFDEDKKRSLESIGFLLCDGHEESKEKWPALYAVIGDSWGRGQGGIKFKLPDLRGRFLRGVDQDAGNDPDAKSRSASAQGGNSGDAVGSYQTDALQSHFHTLKGFAVEPRFQANSKGDPYTIGGLANVSGSTDVRTTEPIAPPAQTTSETRPKNVAVFWIIRAR